MSQPRPVPNATQSFWRSSELDSLDNYRSTPELPSHADVVIIGAGYSGASVAHHVIDHLGRSSRQPSIVILEAREACSGATGRNGGHLKPDPYIRAAKVLELVDKTAADEVTTFEARHIKAIGDLAKRENIDCDFVITRATDVCLDDSGVADQKAKIERLTAAGIAGLDDVFFSEGEAAEMISGVKGAKSCVSHTSAHLYPYRLVMHMLRKAVEQGVNLQTNTPVSSVSTEVDHEGQWTINTNRGSIKTPIVVYATNGYTSALVPELKGKIVPVKGICSRIVSPKPRSRFLPTSSVLRFNDHEYDYLIPRTDGSIVVGGGRRDYFQNLDSWFDSYDDSKLIESAKTYFDGYMQRHFIGWEDSEATVEKLWVGIMGYTNDGLPYVGDLAGKPGQYILAGFNGHGMPQAFLSAKAIASMIVDGVKLEDTDLPRLYRSTQRRFDSTLEHASLTAYKAAMSKLGQNGVSSK